MLRKLAFVAVAVGLTLPVWALFRTYGSLRVAATMAELLGFVEAPCLPRPLKSLAGEDRARVEEALRLSGLGA